jgi:RHS repeat-associated protein
MRCILTLRKSTIVFFLLIAIALFIGCSRRDKTVILEQYKFDSQGRLICKIAPDGGGTTYKYNKQGLLIEIRYPDGWVRYSYDENGNRIWMKDKTGTTEYYYDALDRLVGVIWKHSPWQLIIYDYDPWGYLTYMAIFNLRLMEQDLKYRNMLRELEMKSAEKVQKWRDRELVFHQMIGQLRIEDIQRRQRWMEYEVKYRHDILGNLTTIDTKWGSIKYSYFPDKGQIERRLPNGITTKFAYLPDGLLKSMRHENSMGQLIAEYRYDYNAVGKVIKAYELTPEGLRTTGYDWDNRGYLKELQLPDKTKILYDYDAMGNRILKQDARGSLQYKYDKFARLITAGDLRYEWDRNGNMYTQVDRQLKTRIKYDGRNLPALVRMPEATIQYDWDGDGNMISRYTEKEITHYLPNPSAPSGFTLAEFGKTGKLTASYLYGDILLGQLDMSGQARYFLEDGFNSIRHITDMNGKIVGRRDYTPFAEPINIKGDMSCNFRMMGERYLPELKSYVIGQRLYEPNAGRYLVPDAFPGYMERFDSFNRYAHACNAPGLFMEPRCNQISKQSTYPILNYWSGFAGNFFRELPETMGQGLKAVEDFWGQTWSNIWSGQGLGWEWGPHPGTFAAQAEQYGGPLARKAVQSVFIQGVLSELELLTAGTLPKFRIHLGSWGHIASGERAAHGALHVGISAIGGGKAILHFYLSRLFIHGLDIPYGLLPYMLPLSKDDGGGSSILGGDLFAEGDQFNDPLKLIENQLAGIKLAATGEFIGYLGNIAGAVYDPEKQCLVLVGDEDPSVPSIKAEDLAVALMCVFGPKPQDPQFSLDPADSRNPKGEWLKKVYIPEEIIGGTEFGKALFEADWLLKQYSFEVKIDEKSNVQERNSSVLKDQGQPYIGWSNYSVQERKSTVSDFKSTADLFFEEQKHEYGEEKWARFWIESDDMKLKQADKSIYFDVAKMRVKAKKQVIDPSSPTGLRDVDTQDDPVAMKFATSFTELYDEIAKESPEFERVRELAKAVAFAKWLKKEGIPVDMNWVEEKASGNIPITDSLKALSVQWEKKTQQHYQKGNLIGIETTTHQIRLFGGVDLTVNPKYITDDGTTLSLQEAVRSKLKQEDTGPVFTVEHNGKSFRAEVLPVTGAGREMWKGSPCVEINGIVYQFNNKREATKSIDMDGNATEYAYDSNRKLKTVKVSNSNGWKIIGERKQDGSLWTATDPRGNTFKFNYDDSGFLNEIDADGHTWATYEINGDGDKNSPHTNKTDHVHPHGHPSDTSESDQNAQKVIIRYDSYTEKITYDGNHNIREYEIQTQGKGPALLPETERLFLDYDQSGNLTKIDGSGVNLVNISYSEDGVKPVKITTPLVEIQYLYNSEGQVEEIKRSDGISMTYEYDGKQLTKLQVDHRDKQAEYLFNKDGIVQNRDLLGGIPEYGYINGRLSSVKLVQYGEARYLYDDQNTLKEIYFPDGSWIEYQCEVEERHGGKSAGLQIQTLTVVIHPASEHIKEQNRR